MRFRAFAILAAAGLALAASAAVAQNVIVIEKTERLTIVELHGLANTVSYAKELPLGYQHFTPVARAVRMSSNAVVVCQAATQQATQEAAIAFGKRLWLGYSPDQAVNELINARKSVDCGYRNGMTLVSREVAVRGDDKGRRVLLIKWDSDNGTQYLTALPCRGNRLNCQLDL